jgi:hypothetical protein
MFFVVDRESYQAGQTLEGRLFIDLFIPCFQNRLMIRLSGHESFPARQAEQAL